eukprot:scaffold268704_cov18-Tisochrysis_lutea.AAC.1
MSTQLRPATGSARRPFLCPFTKWTPHNAPYRGMPPCTLHTQPRQSRPPRGDIVTTSIGLYAQRGSYEKSESA